MEHLVRILGLRSPRRIGGEKALNQAKPSLVTAEGSDPLATEFFSSGTSTVLQWREWLFGLPASEWVMAAAMMKLGHFERGLVRFLRSRCSPDSSYVEVGASYGIVFVPVVQLIGPGGWADAWEPDPIARDYLWKNLHLNGHEQSSWLRVLPDAAGEELGKRILNISSRTRTHSSFWLEEANTLERVEVSAHRLDSVYRRPIDILKIDAEGAEWEILEGARGLLEAGKIRLIALEFGPSNLHRAGREPSDFLSMLEELGGRISVIDKQTGELQPYDRRQVLDSFSVNLSIDFS